MLCIESRERGQKTCSMSCVALLADRTPNFNINNPELLNQMRPTSTQNAKATPVSEKNVSHFEAPWFDIVVCSLIANNGQPTNPDVHPPTQTPNPPTQTSNPYYHPIWNRGNNTIRPHKLTTPYCCYRDYNIRISHIYTSKRLTHIAIQNIHEWFTY